MISEITVKNFKTHLDTKIKLYPVTLFIGSNGSGKSNFLRAVSFLAQLLRKSNPSKLGYYEPQKAEYYSNKHSLIKDKAIEFEVVAKEGDYSIIYGLTLQVLNEEMKVDEWISIENNLNHGKWELRNTNKKRVELRAIVEKSEEFGDEEKTVCKNFLRNIAYSYYYNFQPNSLRSVSISKNKENVISILGENGEGFEEALKLIKEDDTQTYNRFLAYLKRFDNSFVAIDSSKKEGVRWQFDMGSDNFPYFKSSEISDGFMKAAVVALLCSLKNPPSLIMLEEIENGVNQKNVSEFISWLKSTANGGGKVQFIITSHSPSVIREFSKYLSSIYNFHLRKRKGFVSEVINLSDAIGPMVKFGTIKEDQYTEVDGTIYIEPSALTELFYNGILAEL